MSKYKAYVFDLDDTLYDRLQPFSRTFKSLFPDQEHLPLEEVFTSFRQHGDRYFDLATAGYISVREMQIKRIQASLQEFGLTLSADQALHFQQTYLDFQDKIELSADMVKLLKDLADKPVDLAIITNGPEGHQKNKFKQLGLDQWFRTDRLFISTALGVRKPDPKIFQLAADTLQVAPDHLLYIGDSYNNDVLGAKAAGWDALWFERRPIEIAGTKPGYDYLVKTESDLVDLVKQLSNC